MPFVKLQVNTGGPQGIVSIEMPGVTTLRYAALRVAEYLGIDTDENRFTLLDPQSLKAYAGERLAADYDGVIFVLGTEVLGK